jgi:hypothetical protein
MFGWFGPPKNLKQAIQRLVSTDEDRREEGRTYLEQSGESLVVAEALLPYLNHKNKEVRHAAWNYLKPILEKGLYTIHLHYCTGYAQRLEYLLVHQQFYSVFGGLYYIEKAVEKDGEVDSSLIQAVLQDMRREEKGIAAWLFYIYNPDGYTSYDQEVLDLLGENRTLEGLLALLAKLDIKHVWRIIEILGALGNRRAIEPLRQFKASRTSSNNFNYNLVLCTLGELGELEMLPQLISSIGDGVDLSHLSVALYRLLELTSVEEWLELYATDLRQLFQPLLALYWPAEVYWPAVEEQKRKQVAEGKEVKEKKNYLLVAVLRRLVESQLTSPHLVELLKNQQGELPANVIAVLVNWYGTQVWLPLLYILSLEDEVYLKLRIEVAWKLMAFENWENLKLEVNEGLWQALSRTLEHEEQDLRLGAAWVLTELSWYGYAGVDHTVATLFEHGSWEMRYWAARKLFYYHSDRISKPAFEKVLAEEPVLEVRKWAELYLLHPFYNRRNYDNLLGQLSLHRMRIPAVGWRDDDEKLYTRPDEFLDETAVDILISDGDIGILHLCLFLRPNLEIELESETGQKKVGRELSRYYWFKRSRSYEGELGIAMLVDANERLSHDLPKDMRDWSVVWYDWKEGSTNELVGRNGLKVLMASNSRVALSTLESYAKLSKYGELRPEIEAAISRIRQQAS